MSQWGQVRTGNQQVNCQMLRSDPILGHNQSCASPWVVAVLVRARLDFFAGTADRGTPAVWCARFSVFRSIPLVGGAMSQWGQVRAGNQQVNCQMLRSDPILCQQINLNPGRNEQILREKQGHRNGMLLF